MLKSFFNQILYIIHSYSFIQSFPIHNFFSLFKAGWRLSQHALDEGKGRQPGRHINRPTHSCSHSHPQAIYSFQFILHASLWTVERKWSIQKNPRAMQTEDTNTTNKLLTYLSFLKICCLISVIHSCFLLFTVAVSVKAFYERSSFGENAFVLSCSELDQTIDSIVVFVH